MAIHTPLKFVLAKGGQPIGGLGILTSTKLQVAIVNMDPVSNLAITTLLKFNTYKLLVVNIPPQQSYVQCRRVYTGGLYRKSDAIIS